MHILGISCHYHDAAACLLKDGEVIAAAEEERFSRIKHDSSFPHQAIQFCLDFAKIKGPDLDHVVFNEKPFLKFERILKTLWATYPASCGIFQDAMINWMADKLWIKSTIEEKIGVPKEKIKFCEHHLSHAASSFYCSPFAQAAILTCDGVGEWATTCLGSGQADWNTGGTNGIHLSEEILFPHSLGLLYSAFTAFLGFEVNEGEYKVMGMAGFGEPRYTDKVYKMIRVHDDASFWLDMSYFAFHSSARRAFSRKFEKLFGKPRDPREDEGKIDRYYADVAASIQKVTEDILVKMARRLYEKTGLKKLCLAGGVTLNCLANSRILKETPFEEVFIQPAAGDSGSAMGAALFFYHSYLNKPRRFILNHAFWGKEYSRPEIAAFLDKHGLKHLFFAEEDQLLDFTVKALMSGKVIGWFQGRSEWGPRALGNRSILADPRDEKMKDIVNIKIKFREPFRPFAPSALAGRAQDLFKLEKFDNQSPLKFMLYTVPVQKEGLIPAVTHVDGSSRLQVVDSETNPRFYKLIERFAMASGIPVLLNTSFNLKGEPIVNSPQDAYNTFMKSEMDALVLGDFVLQKNP